MNTSIIIIVIDIVMSFQRSNLIVALVFYLQYQNWRKLGGKGSEIALEECAMLIMVVNTPWISQTWL